MPSVNMLQAKSSLSRLVEAIEQGEEREIVIARNGRSAAKLVPMDSVPAGKRVGVAKGKSSRYRTASTPTTRKSRACSWVGNLESAARYARRPVGDRRQPQAAEGGARNDRVAEVVGLDQRRDILGDRHQAQPGERRHAGV